VKLLLGAIQLVLSYHLQGTQLESVYTWYNVATGPLPGVVATPQENNYGISLTWREPSVWQTGQWL